MAPEASETTTPATPAPRRPLRGPAFLQPGAQETPQEPLSPPQSPQESPAGASRPGSSPGASDAPHDESTDPSGAARTSSKGSSASPLSKAALREAVQHGVLMAGTVAHETLTSHDPIAQESTLWLADHNDAKAIGDPLADIAARRGGVAGSLGNPDLVDGLKALIGVAVYVSKQLQVRAALKAQRRAQAIEAERSPEPQDV